MKSRLKLVPVLSIRKVSSPDWCRSMSLDLWRAVSGTPMRPNRPDSSAASGPVNMTKANPWVPRGFSGMAMVVSPW